jgi:2-methylisocitrate lyase-like PEP mutase family enzyme
MRIDVVDGIGRQVTGEWSVGKDTGGREQPSRDQVSRLAYQFYEERGRAEGHDLDDWLEAEQELARHLRARPARNAFAARRAKFCELHRGECFVLPNPWDVGSARYLEQTGFPGLATTSGGFAFSRGLPDSESAVPRDQMLAHIGEIVDAVDVPVTADFASGYGARPEDVEVSVALCVATGVAGLSIEDGTGDPTAPFYDISVATERVRAARRAIDRTGRNVVLTARAECYRLGHPNAYIESMRRLQAYAQAGADVLFAPGVRSPDEIKALVEVVAPRPLHLLVSGNIGLGVSDIAALGVRRISVGCALALAAWAGMMRAAHTLKNLGSFAAFDETVSFSRMNEFLAADRQARTLPGARHE